MGLQVLFYMVVYANSVIIFAFVFLKRVPGFYVSAANVIIFFIGATAGAFGLVNFLARETSFFKYIPDIDVKMSLAVFALGGMIGGPLLVYLRLQVIPQRGKSAKRK